MNGIGSAGRIAVPFTDRSGTCSATPNAFTSPFVQNNGRQFARVMNNNATAIIYIYDKVGVASVASSIVLQPGDAYVWDSKLCNNPIQVASPTASATFEAAEGG